MTADVGPDRYPATPRGPKHDGWQLLKIPFMLSVYSVPAVARVLDVTVPGPETAINSICVVVPALWVLFGIVLHSETIELGNDTEGADELTTVLGFPQSGKWAPESNPVDVPTAVDFDDDPDLATLRLEYESLLAEAQYRDKLLLRTTYFALGAIGLFAGVLSTSSTTETPAIAMMASVVMLAFAIAANSYKDSRDALWDRIGRLEHAVPTFRGTLTTFNTIRGMDLRLFNTLSLSTYTVGLTIFMTAMAYAVYLWAVLFSG